MKTKKTIISENNTFRKYFMFLRGLGLISFINVLKENCFSINKYYVLIRNLKSLQFERTIKFHYYLDKITLEDWETLNDQIKLYDPDTRREFYSRLLFYEAGLKNCYVLKNKNNEIACMSWIIYPSENEIIRNRLKDRFLNIHIRKNQVMLEKIFTIPKFRGFGFSPTLTIELLRLAKREGFNNAIINVKNDRIDSLNDIMRLGFKIIKQTTEYKIFGLALRPS